MNNDEKSVEVLPAELPTSEVAIAKDLDTDYEYTRDNLKAIIDKGSEALDGILELAKETDHPRGGAEPGNLGPGPREARDEPLHWKAY